MGTKGPLMRKILLVLLMIMGLMEVTEAHSAVQAGGNFFERGKTQLSLRGSSGRAFDQNYLVLGVGAGYFVARGLEVGLDLDAWLGDEPTLYEVTPSIRYVLDIGNAVYPYIGAFYTRTFYEDLEDLDAAGLRAGFFSSIGARTRLGVGLVYNQLLDCDDDIYDSCAVIYPEAVISFSF